MSLEETRPVAAGETLAEAVATVTPVTYPIAPGYSVNVRSGPGTQYRVVDVLAPGSRVSVHCQTPGTSVHGPYGTSNIWDCVGTGRYVSDAYVNTGSDGYIAPHC